MRAARHRAASASRLLRSWHRLFTTRSTRRPAGAYGRYRSHGTSSHNRLSWQLMQHTFIARAAGVLSVALLAAGCERMGPSKAAAVFDEYCTGCHNPTDLDGGFAFADLDLGN